MKTYFRLLTAIAMLCANHTHSQTLVNREWVRSTGNPNLQFDYTTSTFDQSNHLIVIGNTYVNGQAENFLVTKYAEDSVMVWQRQFDYHHRADYATCVVTRNNVIYVSGA